jgi:hypothetical protein
VVLALSRGRFITDLLSQVLSPSPLDLDSVPEPTFSLAFLSQNLLSFLL